MIRKLFIPAALLALLSAVVPATAGAAVASRAQACPGAYSIPRAATMPQARTATICLMNFERALRRQVPLRASGGLTTAGNRHSADMVSRRYFSHVSSGNVSFTTRILRTRYVAPRGAWQLGENIAWGGGELATPAATVGAWMRSPGHRANILKSTYREVGVGMTLGTPTGIAGATYAAEYGRRG